MKVIGTTSNIVKEFVEALGFNSKKLYSMSLKIEPGYTVQIEAVILVFDEDMQELVKVVKKYELHAKEVEKNV